MKSLEEKILREGTVLPGNILKVGSFLNHMVDPRFIEEMGKEIARLFRQDDITKVLTIETSGIPIAFAAALSLGVPMVFDKKNKTANLSGDFYRTTVHSYTHGNDYDMIVAKEYISPDDRVLLVDDFLANGAALNGLIELVSQAGAKTVGASCAIEKGFQRGGDKLRESGLKVESLAVIDRMTDDSIVFRG